MEPDDVDVAAKEQFRRYQISLYLEFVHQNGSSFSKLAENASNGLGEDEWKKFFDLVYVYADIFADSTSELGGMSKLKHSIDTGTEPPIWQLVRWIPPQHRNEGRQIVDDMLKRGVIERWTYLWASPIVLVHKKDDSIRCQKEYCC